MAVIALALLVVASGLGNGFALDDVKLLVEDPRLHEIGTLPTRLMESWWPTGLFRPVSLAVLGLQWIAGAGAPWVFRIVSTLLYAAVCVGVLRLCHRAGAPPQAALAGALVFAVHPVHSEVTANIVGQAEMLASLAAIAAVAWYLKARQLPSPSWTSWAGITMLSLVSANAKETGYVVPALLVAAELLVVQDRRRWGERIATLRPLAWSMAAAFSASLLVRDRVLGSLGGELPHPALGGLSVMERAAGMLAVVPEWTRLLLWPARLQAEYGPPELVMDSAIGSRHLIGAIVVGAVLGSIWWTRRRAPLMAFGLTWMGICLAPVANIVFPTGILLAERTLFLPSVGLALGFAGAWARADPIWSRRPGTRKVVIAVLAVVVVVAGAWSARRQPAWRDTLTIVEQTSRDASGAYRAHFNHGRALAHLGRHDEAEAAFHRAIALWDRDSRPFEELGQLLRRRGACGQAIPVLEQAVRADSTSDFARSRLVECLIVEHRWDEAEREIARGMAQGIGAYEATRQRVHQLRGQAP